MKKLSLVLLCAALAFPLLGKSAAKSCVVYFSWSDSANTQRAAAVIAEKTGADLVRLQPAEAYSRVYKEVLSRGKAELKENKACPIQKISKDLKQYETLFVGTPIWFGTYAPPVKTFLQQNDLKGKKVYLFCTHGRGGAGRFFTDAAKLLPNAAVSAKGFSCYGDKVGNAAPDIEKWLKENVK